MPRAYQSGEVKKKRKGPVSIQMRDPLGGRTSPSSRVGLGTRVKSKRKRGR